MVTCEYVRERLVAYDDHELPASEHEAIGSHLESCKSCANEMAALGQAMDQLRAYLTEPIESREREPVRMSLAPARHRFRTTFRITSLAASVAAIVGIGALVLVHPQASLAQEVMQTVASRIRTIMNFSVAFERRFAYSTPQPGGYSSAQVTGDIRCVLQPKKKLRVTEAWQYADAEGHPLPEYSETNTWANTGATEWSRTLRGNATVSNQRSVHPRSLTDTFAFADGENLLPPSPRYAAYEFTSLLEGLTGQRYRRWFGKKWTEAEATPAASNRAARVRFQAVSGYETWELIMIADAMGTPAEVRMNQMLTDSTGKPIGTVTTVYTIRETNGAMDDRLFEY